MCFRLFPALWELLPLLLLLLLLLFSPPMILTSLAFLVTSGMAMTSVKLILNLASSVAIWRVSLSSWSGRFARVNTRSLHDLNCFLFEFFYEKIFFIIN